jgi:hypothetical protein
VTELDANKEPPGWKLDSPFNRTETRLQSYCKQVLLYNGQNPLLIPNKQLLGEFPQIYLTSFIDDFHQLSTLFSLSFSILLFLIGLMFSASS